jgi:hypothetical protein
MSRFNAISRFTADKRGAVAYLFALSLVGLLGAGGLAVDYSRGVQAKAALHAASDAAALAAARTYGTPAERLAVARQVFNANIKNQQSLQGISLVGKNILRDGRNYGFEVTVQGDIKTTLGRVLGIDELGVKTFSQAIAAIGTRTEVSLVLDTTYSMTGWKIATLKTAASRMVDELHGMSPPPEFLKIGIVPFSQYVNIGMQNRRRPWMDVPEDYVEFRPRDCYNECTAHTQSNCRMQNFPAEPAQPAIPPTPPGTCTGYNDGVPYSYSCGGSSGRDAIPARPARTEQVCDRTCSASRQVCPPPQRIEHKWHGCIGSRNYPLDTHDSSYVNRIPGLMDQHCGTPIVELTSNAATVKNTINALNPNGETYIPQGLMWGWRMLSPQAPLESHNPSSTEPVRKFLVLMTDGLNTKSPTYPKHDGGDGTLSNSRVREICSNISADRVSNITIFSVAFAVTDAATKKILSDCAAVTNGQFFDAQNQAQFVEAFSKITSQIAELRLSK